MNHRNLKIFLEVCKTKNITKASSNLYLAQPAVSLAIKELEDEYATTLFLRNTKSLTITDSGMKLMHYATEIMKIYNEIETTFTSGNNEILNLGSSITIAEHFLPQYIKAYKQTQNPSTIRVTIETPDIIIRKILSREIDFAFIDADHPDDKLECTPYFTDHFVAISSKKHHLTRKAEVTFDEFLKYDLLLREQGSGERELIETIFKKRGIHKLPLWESSSTKVLINGVTENLGVTILPLELIRDRLYIDDIQCINITDVNLKRYFYLIKHKDAILSSTMKEFIDIATNLYK
ncbi:LysR family transcriptional regulator [Anaerorhabdus furcosa]|uniref:DNA-binding transcriptional regulator, LysR family n=1 Tax=Anaerorhabdus furcosa TaxID=118967 RepID=A0A1T4Q300_9FIRM|nr:LysR family transcriptional regulator [Anaerorhabdus furcosa]SJZ98143.1 DNA-binding transcriptional regulator, LysR family [Anaerorhabdus furcosa]